MISAKSLFGHDSIKLTEKSNNMLNLQNEEV